MIEELIDKLWQIEKQSASLRKTKQELLDQLMNVTGKLRKVENELNELCGEQTKIFDELKKISQTSNIPSSDQVDGVLCELGNEIAFKRKVISSDSDIANNEDLTFKKSKIENGFSEPLKDDVFIQNSFNALSRKVLNELLSPTDKLRKLILEVIKDSENGNLFENVIPNLDHVISQDRSNPSTEIVSEKSSVKKNSEEKTSDKTKRSNLSRKKCESKKVEVKKETKKAEEKKPVECKETKTDQKSIASKNERRKKSTTKTSSPGRSSSLYSNEKENSKIPKKIPVKQSKSHPLQKSQMEAQTNPPTKIEILQGYSIKNTKNFWEKQMNLDENQSEC